MANDGEFREQVRSLGKLVAQFDELPDSEARTSGKELLRLLMDLHCKAFERTMEIIFDSGERGPAIIDTLGKDHIVSSLLLLYSLHPDELETRVQSAVERIRPRLRKLACTVELVQVDGEAVQVRLSTSGHSCGSSAQDLRSIVEDGIYDLAPDITSLEILGPDDLGSSGFVALESLVGHSLVGAASTTRAPEADGPAMNRDHYA